MLEKKFEKDVVQNLLRLYPGAYVIKTNANHIQGFPDRIMLYYNFWVAFDTKRHAKSSRQPNQEFYIRALDKLSMAMFVSPENESEFYHGIQRALEARR
jgi:hypothetical protein